MANSKYPGMCRVYEVYFTAGDTDVVSGPHGESCLTMPRALLVAHAPPRAARVAKSLTPASYAMASGPISRKRKPWQEDRWAPSRRAAGDRALTCGQADADEGTRSRPHEFATSPHDRWSPPRMKIRRGYFQVSISSDEVCPQNVGPASLPTRRARSCSPLPPGFLEPLGRGVGPLHEIQPAYAPESMRASPGRVHQHSRSVPGSRVGAWWLQGTAGAKDRHEHDAAAHRSRAP